MSVERSCDEITLRLIEGVRAADDAEIGRHLGTCLRCFRVASDLRELPQLTAQLREAHSFDDPGERFWASFPERVSVAYLPPAQPERSSLWTRLVALLRFPVPAALASAAASALLVLVVVHHRQPAAPAIAPARVAAAPLQLDEAAVDRIGDELAFAALQGADEADDEEAWNSLNLRDLQTVASRLSEPSRTTGSEDPDVNVYDDLEALGTEDLRVLSKALGGRKGI
jgi:hypothetical protein